MAWQKTCAVQKTSKQDFRTEMMSFLLLLRLPSQFNRVQWTQIRWINSNRRLYHQRPMIKQFNTNFIVCVFAFSFFSKYQFLSFALSPYDKQWSARVENLQSIRTNCAQCSVLNVHRLTFKNVHILSENTSGSNWRSMTRYHDYSGKMCVFWSPHVRFE